MKNLVAGFSVHKCPVTCVHNRGCLQFRSLDWRNLHCTRCIFSCGWISKTSLIPLYNPPNLLICPSFQKQIACMYCVQTSLIHYETNTPQRWHIGEVSLKWNQRLVEIDLYNIVTIYCLHLMHNMYGIIILSY